MNWLLPLLLLALAWFFLQNGEVFFAFLLVLIALIISLSSPRAEKAPAAAPAPGTVVTGTQYPSEMKIRVQPTWGGGKSGEEKIGESLRKAVNTTWGAVEYVFKKLFG